MKAYSIYNNKEGSYTTILIDIENEDIFRHFFDEFQYESAFLRNINITIQDFKKHMIKLGYRCVLVPTAELHWWLHDA